VDQLVDARQRVGGSEPSDEGSAGSGGSGSAEGLATSAVFEGFGDGLSTAGSVEVVGSGLFESVLDVPLVRGANTIEAVDVGGASPTRETSFRGIEVPLPVVASVRELIGSGDVGLAVVQREVNGKTLLPDAFHSVAEHRLDGLTIHLT